MTHSNYADFTPLLRSRQEARELLNIGLTTLDKLLEEGKLQKVKIGRRALVTDESIRRFVTQQCEEYR